MADETADEKEIATSATPDPDTPKSRREAEALAWQEFERAVEIEAKAEAETRAARARFDAARADRMLARTRLNHEMEKRNRLDLTHSDTEAPTFPLPFPLTGLQRTILRSLQGEGVSLPHEVAQAEEMRRMVSAGLIAADRTDGLGSYRLTLPGLAALLGAQHSPPADEPTT